MTITTDLLNWYDRNKRAFAFRGTRDPYRIWISEIMLQQTRTETAEGYFIRFIDQFPDVFALAGAPEQQVLKAWEGLGYYSRARNQHQTARIIAEQGGLFPRRGKRSRSSGCWSCPGLTVSCCFAGIMKAWTNG